MRPYMFSKKDFLALVDQNGQISNQLIEESWRPGGQNVKYYEDTTEAKRQFYTMSFEYTFQHAGDQVLMAACPPYSYSLLKKNIQKWKNKAQPVKLTKSVCGLEVPLLTFSRKPENSRYIVIMARSHPGQTSGSWVVDGLIDWLCSDDEAVKELLSRVTVKIVPMMNPDGVYMGNYRTGIPGKDINRSFFSGKHILFPEIAAMKSLINDLEEQGQVLCLIDFHGHSILRNSFIFGPAASSFSNNPLRKLPQELSEYCDLFKYSNCRFLNEKCKIETARVYFQMKARLLSFTLENSLGLWKKPSDGRIFQILIRDWKKFGEQIGKILSNMMNGIYTSTKQPSNVCQNYFSNQLLPKNKIRIVQKKVEPVSISQQKINDPMAELPSTSEGTNNYPESYHSQMLVNMTENELTWKNAQNQQQDGFSDRYDSDQNDEDDCVDDLPEQMLLNVFKAIEATELYGHQAYEIGQNIVRNIEEKTTEQVIQQQIMRNRWLKASRQTNGFKQMKLNIRRLTPSNAAHAPPSALSIQGTSADKSTVHESLIVPDRKNDHQPSSRDRLEVIQPQKQKKSKKKYEPTDFNSTMTRLVCFQKQIMEQVNSEIDSKMKRVKEKPRSIFNRRAVIDELTSKNGFRLPSHSPTLYGKMK